MKRNRALIWARNQGDHTQGQAAALACVARETFARWESGHCQMPKAKWLKFLKAVEIQPEDVPEHFDEPPSGATYQMFDDITGEVIGRNDGRGSTVFSSLYAARNDEVRLVGLTAAAKAAWKDPKGSAIYKMHSRKSRSNWSPRDHGIDANDSVAQDHLIAFKKMGEVPDSDGKPDNNAWQKGYAPDPYKAYVVYWMWFLSLRTMPDEYEAAVRARVMLYDTPDPEGAYTAYWAWFASLRPAVGSGEDLA